MDNEYLQIYLEYKESGSQEIRIGLASKLYREISYWLELKEPAPGFLQDFSEFFDTVHARGHFSRDLIDLGLIETMEAVHSYRDYNDEVAVTAFFLNEARLPFYAIINEESYRGIKNIEFSEIDFPVFEILGGEFPHDAAQNLLTSNEWVDVWIALRYLDTLDSENRLIILERMLHVRVTIPEKLILIGYLCITNPEVILDQPETFIFPEDLDTRFFSSLKEMLVMLSANGNLDCSFEQNLGTHSDEVLFVLLSIFEISQGSLSPGWIRLFEIAVGNLWTVHYSEDSRVREQLHQPLASFSASIISMMSDEEALPMLETSRIPAVFFENIGNYMEDAFFDLLTALSRNEDIFLEELRWELSSRKRRSRMLKDRLQRCAHETGHEIITRNGRYQLRLRQSH